MVSPEQWRQVSPLLDELAELGPAAAEDHLARIGHERPELGALLAELRRLERRRPDFLARPLHAGAEPPLQAGERIGPYRLEQLLGEGGMGQVWAARRDDGLYERRVALKLMRSGYADARLRAWFERERRILARLAHANIAGLLEAGEAEDGRAFLAIEFVRGEPVTDHAQRNALGIHERLRLFTGICAAVSHAHANLVVHCDLKPSNILVTPAGEVRVLDFGAGRLLDAPHEDPEGGATASPASAPFTLEFAAPEQLRGEPVATTSDVYSLGVVLYHLLAGHGPGSREGGDWLQPSPAERGPRPPSVVAAGGDAPARRRARELAGALDAIVLKAMHAQPARRYNSADALARDVERVLEGRRVDVGRPRWRSGLARLARRCAWRLGLVG